MIQNMTDREALDRVVAEVVGGILSAPDDKILADVREHYGDEADFVADVDEVFNRVTSPQRRNEAAVENDDAAQEISRSQTNVIPFPIQPLPERRGPQKLDKPMRRCASFARRSMMLAASFMLGAIIYGAVDFLSARPPSRLADEVSVASKLRGLNNFDENRPSSYYRSDSSEHNYYRQAHGSSYRVDYPEFNSYEENLHPYHYNEKYYYRKNTHYRYYNGEPRYYRYYGQMSNNYRSDDGAAPR